MAGWGGLVFVGAFRPTKTGGCFRREPADENSSFARILGLSLTGTKSTYESSAICAGFRFRQL